MLGDREITFQEIRRDQGPFTIEILWRKMGLYKSISVANHPFMEVEI